jgi:hypothetical protein
VPNGRLNLTNAGINAKKVGGYYLALYGSIR